MKDDGEAQVIPFGVSGWRERFHMRRLATKGFEPKAGHRTFSKAWIKPAREAILEKIGRFGANPSLMKSLEILKKMEKNSH